MSNLKSQPIRITDHLFQLGTPSFPVYLSLGEEGMIIEGGTGPTAEIIVRQVEALGIDPMRIRHMALTHTHPDHIGALPRLRKIWPHMEVIAGTTSAHFLSRDTLARDFIPTDRTIGKLLKEAGIIEELPPPLDEYRFQADRVVAQGEEIHLGNGISWNVFFTPGHSPCHTSFYESKEDILVVGDACGLYDEGKDVFWPNYFFSLDDYCRSIRSMIDLPAAIALLSHNGVIRNGVSKFLAKGMIAAEQYHLGLLRRVSRDEDPERICTDNADWVWSLGPLASYKAILFLCNLLLKRSLKEKERVDFSLPTAAAA